MIAVLGGNKMARKAKETVTEEVKETKKKKPVKTEEPKKDTVEAVACY